MSKTDYEYYLILKDIVSGNSTIKDHQSDINNLIDSILEMGAMDKDRHETMYYDSYEDHYSSLGGHYQTSSVSSVDTSVLEFLRDEEGTSIHDLVSNDVITRLVPDIYKSYNSYNNEFNMEDIIKTDSYQDALTDIEVSIDEAVRDNHKHYDQ